jgi:hypothetical protein
MLVTCTPAVLGLMYSSAPIWAFRHGLVILGRSEMSEGVGRFRAGAGRGGADLDAS